MVAVLSIVLVLVVVLLVVVVVGFNRLRVADVAAQEALGGIDVALTRRADLVPNLVETVKAYAAHEKGLLEELTAARTRAVAATGAGSGSGADDGGDRDVAARADADAALSAALVRVAAVSESSPELRAVESFSRLQAELATTEDHLAAARQDYNAAAGALNQLTQTVPWMLATGVAGVRRREFYDAPAGHHEPPQVRF